MEQDFLEKGIKLEDGKSSRGSIFAGPLFLDDDPVYASVKVALSFFKIVAWYDDEGALQATGFRLSQEKLIGAIEWEEQHIDALLKPNRSPLIGSKSDRAKISKGSQNADTNKQ